MNTDQQPWRVFTKHPKAFFLCILTVWGHMGRTENGFWHIKQLKLWFRPTYSMFAGFAFDRKPWSESSEYWFETLVSSRQMLYLVYRYVTYCYGTRYLLERKFLVFLRNQVSIKLCGSEMFLSRIRFFTSRIQGQTDSGSRIRTKELKYFNPENRSNFSENIPGFSSRVRTRIFSPSRIRIQDPGIKKALDPGFGSATLCEYVGHPYGVLRHLSPGQSQLLLAPGTRNWAR
jgi:hypothetical protein